MRALGQLFEKESQEFRKFQFSAFLTLDSKSRLEIAAFVMDLTFIKQELDLHEIELDFGTTLNDDDLSKMNIKKENAEKTLVQLLNEQNLAEDIDLQPKKLLDDVPQDEGYFSGASSNSSGGSSPESNGSTSPEAKHGHTSPDGHQTQDFEKMVPPKEVLAPLASLSAESVEKTLNEVANETSEAIVYYEDPGMVKQEFSFQSSYQGSYQTAYYVTEPAPSYQVQQPQQQQVPIDCQVQKPNSEPSKARGGMENLVVMKNPGLSSVYYPHFQKRHTCYFMPQYPCHSCSFNQMMYQRNQYMWHQQAYKNSSWSMVGQGQTSEVKETKPQVWSRKMSTMRSQKTDKGKKVLFFVTIPSYQLIFS